MTDDLRYPIGTWTKPASITDADRRAWVEEIARAPAALRKAATGLTDAQLDTHYRPGGWTVRQVVHHVPDSHMNAYIRFKLALTEDEPTIKPYEEKKWATLADTRTVPVAVSLALLEGIHARWMAVLRSMSPADFSRGYNHPEQNRVVPLGEALSMYAWHGKHHVAHISQLRVREGWT
jgi:DinB family protein